MLYYKCRNDLEILKFEGFKPQPDSNGSKYISMCNFMSACLREYENIYCEVEMSGDSAWTVFRFLQILTKYEIS